jgi:transglutaminase-like putative cysteine protease
VKYRVRHATTYRYGKPVDLASHMLHLAPRALSHQAVLASNIAATPAPARRSQRPDHFGNGVTWLFLDRPHERFEVTLEATVDVLFPRPPEAAATPAWEDVAASVRQAGPLAWQAAEFVFDSPMAPAEAGAGGYAAASFPPGRPVLSGLLDLMGRIRRDFAFRAGVTTISTPVARVLAQRAGVCQDFSHLMIAGLRALGLPARYVSGYLRTKPPPGQRGAARISRTPGSDAGSGRYMAGSISTRPTTSWYATSMSCWPGAGIMATSARSAG